MDGDGLPITGIDLNKIPPIPQKHTVTFINHYLSRSSQLMNELTSAAERRLENVLSQIQQAEASVCILEAKLDSIPGLSYGLSGDPEPMSINHEPQPVVTQQPTAVDEPFPAGEPPFTEPTPVEEQSQAEVVEEPENFNPIKNDPRFKIYFSMVARGVPVPAVQQKMMVEGVDPELIHKPNAPAPPRAPTGEHED